jgi:hypothetical protein
MADGKPVQEPSMEEILTSIRRIIAEDEGAGADAPSHAGGAAVVAASSSPPAAAEPDEVLELTEIVGEAAPRPARPVAAAAAPAPPASPSAPRRQDSAAAAAAAVPPPPTDVAGLISAETAKATAAALARLTRANGADERKLPATAAAHATVEQFLAELLSPMLKEWLDRNLPEIVERVVEQEVKKLARRAELL